MSADYLEVATSGKTVPRSDRCPSCDTPMVYVADDDDVLSMFCPSGQCLYFLMEKAVPK